jgi:uncharacterized protein with PIN domain
VNVVDSSAWIEFLADGPNAVEFAVPIEDSGSLLVPSLTLYEVFKRVAQLKGESAARLEGAVLWTQDVDFAGRDGVEYRAGS